MLSLIELWAECDKVWDMFILVCLYLTIQLKENYKGYTLVDIIVACFLIDFNIQMYTVVK